MSNPHILRDYAADYIRSACRAGLMHTYFQARKGAELLVEGREVVSFANCSYLGLDTDPTMIEAGAQALKDFGLHYCCARTRLSIEPLRQLERGLSRLFGSVAITFPSVTTTHAACLPLIANGLLLEPESECPVHLIFDRFAHASMQSLIPQLKRHATVAKIRHNSISELRAQVRAAKAEGKRSVFLADGVYSMGGLCPLAELIEMMDREGLYLYIDDAHGTSIFGERGEGFVPHYLKRTGRIDTGWPQRLFANFSLAKGFGCNGGGIIVPSQSIADTVRYFGQNYMFSGPLDFAMTGAALKGLHYHFDGTVRRLQDELRKKVALFDNMIFPDVSLPFSPIRMIPFGEERSAIEAGRQLLAKGFYVSTVFFPVVPKKQGQLRVCITTQHSEEDISRLCSAILELTKQIDSGPARVHVDDRERSPTPETP